MCIDSSFVYVNDFCYYRNCLYSHMYKFSSEKKKTGKESQYIVSRPEPSSDLPFGSYRESGCDTAHVVDWGEIKIDTDGTFEEGPVCIMDSRDQVLQRKTVRLVRVLWRHRGVEESTWEREDTMRATYPFLFRDEGTWFSRLILK